MDSSADLHIWDNAAFDNGEISESWGSLKSIFANPKASFDSVSDKENKFPVLENQISSSATPLKPVNTVEKSRIKGFEENVALKKIRQEKKIDEEIEEIESQICRLSSRLEALRLEKAQKSVKIVEKRGKVVQAKFMSAKKAEEKNMVEEMSVKAKFLRRGISLGPAEILSGGRRGMSIGPLEIFGATKSRQEMINPTPVQSRRKSCFWKLKEIDEEKSKSSSLSPKSRKVAAKNQFPPRQAVTTVASRKNLKKEEALINSIQPKNLFKDGEKSVPGTNKKAAQRPGRVVASRYNQSTNQASAMRKRSLPENEMDNSKRVEKKRSLSVEKLRANATENKNVGSESRVKKRWEIPSEIVVHGSVETEDSPAVVPDLLPRIRIARCTNESPRDSGPAKKVVELIGRKSFFGNDEEVEPSVCQALTYHEEEDEEETL